MCLGVPGRIVAVEGQLAHRRFLGRAPPGAAGRRRPAGRAGDYILNHVGFAIRRIPQAEIAETLALYEQLLREASQTI